MGIQADFFVARDDAAHEYGSNPDLFELDCAHFMRITVADLSSIWAILQGITWDESLFDEFPCVVEEDNGEITTQRFPGGMITALSKLSPDQVPSVAGKWAEADELEWPLKDLEEILGELVRLARRALETRQGLFLWNSM
jgi:hypothetical protein